MTAKCVHERLIRRLQRTGWLSQVSIEVGERRFIAPVIDGVVVQCAEPWMPQLLRKLLPNREGYFIDVGVNLGQTILAVKSVDPDRPILGFEPNATCVSYVNKLIDSNALTKIILSPVALAKTACLRHLDLYFDSDVDAAGSIVPQFRPSQPVRRSFLVPALPFETIFGTIGLSNICLVKVDVEGAEAEVLLSMEAVLSRFRPILIVEILPCYSSDNVERLASQRQIEALLNQMEYSLFRIIKDQNNDLAGLDELFEIGIHANLAWSDYICLPSEVNLRSHLEDQMGLS